MASAPASVLHTAVPRITDLMDSGPMKSCT